MSDTRWVGQVRFKSGTTIQVDFYGSPSYQEAELQALSMTGGESVNYLNPRFSKPKSKKQGELSFGSKISIAFFLIGGIIALAYFPFVLSGVLGWFGTKTALSIEKKDTAFKNIQNTFLAKTYIVLIFSAVFGGVGFLGGEYIEKNYLGDSPQELRDEFKNIFKD